jgi:hypothetical protein
VAGAFLVLLFGAAPRANAQTRTLTVPASVTIVSGGVGSCHILSAPCTYFINQGATVRLEVPYSGTFTGGTGPAAGCTLSTCTFVMTADATVTTTTGSGPSATVTVTLAGDGSGGVSIDGLRCTSGSCTKTYWAGSSVQLAADGGASARFTGYSSPTGDASVCGAAATCAFTLNSNSSVTATFLALEGFIVTPSSAFGMRGGPPATFSATGIYSGDVTGIIPGGKGAWSPAPSLPYGVDRLAAAALGGRVYAIGGSTFTSFPDFTTNRLAAFDPIAQTWTVKNSMTYPRVFAAAAVSGNYLYAIGGSPHVSDVQATVERYDPVSDGWLTVASMSAGRRGLVADTVNGVIYAAGGADAGGAPVATLEAYDPATDTWTPRAPMPTPRSFVAGGVVDGILYVAGGSNGTTPVSAVEAYDPATNTWTARAPLPMPLSNATSAVADGVLYVMGGARAFHSAVYAYDPVADAWTARAELGSPRSDFAAASLNGIVYAIAGDNHLVGCCNHVVITVETFVDSLRWSSSAPTVVRIDQNGSAAPLAPGTATIVANVGGQTCGSSCPTFTVVATTMSLDAPADNSSLTVDTTLMIGGWALNAAAPSGTGVDAIHVYAFPSSGPAILLGVATYGTSRPDVGAVFGAQFTNSGFMLAAGGSLPVGAYTIVAYARNALTQQFDASKSAQITLTPAASNPVLAVDTPQPSQVVTSAFEVGGWAIDVGAATGTGVDAVQFYVIPAGGSLPGVFVGDGSYGITRTDVGAAFGSRFTNSGFHFTITGLGPGSYTLAVYARSTVTGGYTILRTVPFTVSGTALMSIDVPGPESTIASSTFTVAGWSIDRTIESTAIPGSGVDALHIYAYPNPGSGTPPIFLGVASLGVFRPDVGAAYGSRYDTSGYQLFVDRSALGLTPGVYSIAVASHSQVTGTFNNIAVVRVTLQ